MTWFKVDDSFHSHSKVRKVLAEAPAALGLWVVAGSWSSANLTDGFVPDHQLPWLLPPDPTSLAQMLVTAGLWRRVRGGYRFHDWTQCNLTAEEVLHRRQVRAEAGRQGGLSSGKTRSKRQANASALAAANGKQVSEPPSRPLPSTKEGGGARPATQGAARAPTAPNALPVEHEPGCGRVSGEVPPDRCRTCLEIRSGPDDDRPNGGPADPDQARRVLREIAARAQPTARALLAAVPDPPSEETA